MKSQPLRIANSYLCIVLVGLSLVALSEISWTEPVAFAKSMGEMAPGQSLGIPSVPNLRDLGGYKTESGTTVAKELVYRSNQISGIPPDDMKKLDALNLKTVYDLRTVEEKERHPDELPSGVNYVWLDVLADSPQAGPAQLEPLMKDPKKANAVLGGGKAAEGFSQSYRELVSLPSARREFSKLFLGVANEKQLPAVFHCTTGKDRTGWAAAALLTLLGVPRDTVYEDYLRSNEYIIPAYQKVIDGFVKAGGDPAIPESILGVNPCSGYCWGDVVFPFTVSFRQSWFTRATYRWFGLV